MSKDIPPGTKGYPGGYKQSNTGKLATSRPGTPFQETQEPNSPTPFDVTDIDIIGVRQLIIDNGTYCTSGPRSQVLFISMHQIPAATKDAKPKYQSDLIRRAIDPKSGKFISASLLALSEGEPADTPQESLWRLLQATADRKTMVAKATAAAKE